MAVLFQWWSISTVWELLLSMLGLFILAFLYEGLKFYRDYLFRTSLASGPQYTSKTDLTIADSPQPVRMSMFSGAHVVQTLLHMLLGSGLGYFFFGWRKSVVIDLTEHCH